MWKQVKIYQTESYTTYIVREPITIDLDDYPELEGMTNDEIVYHLDGNSSEMKATESGYDSLSDELIGNLGDTHLYSNHIEQAEE